MDSTRHRIARGLVVALAAACLASCFGCRISGGGWIPSGTTKATFAFHGECTAGQAPKGNGEYVDHATGIRAHCTVDTINGGTSCPPSTEPISSATLEGTYVPQPRSLGPGGRFTATLTDQGEPGPSKGDYFSISFSGGVYAQQGNAGTLGGGNIQGDAR